MAKHGDRNKREGNPVDGAASGAGLTVLPMLAGSLVLIVVGTIIVTTFA